MVGKHEIMELHEKIVAKAGRLAMGLAVAWFIVIGSGMAVHGLSSELRDPMVVDT
jgi:hypothetical protein